MTKPSEKAPSTIVKEFAKGKGQFKTLETKQDKKGQVVKLQQTVDGVPVFGGIVVGIVDEAGQLKTVVDDAQEVKGLHKSIKLDEKQAIAKYKKAVAIRSIRTRA